MYVRQGRFWERIASSICSFLLSLLCEDMCSAISPLWLPMPLFPHYYEPLSAPQFWRAESCGMFLPFLCKCRHLSVLPPHWRSSPLRASTNWFLTKPDNSWLKINKAIPLKKNLRGRAFSLSSQWYVLVILNILFFFCLFELRAQLLSLAFYSQLPLINFALDSILPFAALNYLDAYCSDFGILPCLLFKLGYIPFPFPRGMGGFKSIWSSAAS